MPRPDNIEIYEYIAQALQTTIYEAPNGTIFVHGSDISGINVSVEARKETQVLTTCGVTLSNPKLETYDPKARRSMLLLNPKAIYLNDGVIALSDDLRNGFVIGPEAVAIITRCALNPAEELKPVLIPA